MAKAKYLRILSFLLTDKYKKISYSLNKKDGIIGG